MIITQDFLKSILSYDPESGIFTWLERTGNAKWNATRAGKIAGRKNRGGYMCSTITVDQKTTHILLHRVAWLYVYGSWPSGVIDHVNHIKSDNRIANLRDVSARVNRINVHPRHEAKGYTWNKRVRRWQVYITINGRAKYLGLFDQEDDARLAYLNARHARDASLGIAPPVTL